MIDTIPSPMAIPSFSWLAIHVCSKQAGIDACVGGCDWAEVAIFLTSSSPPLRLVRHRHAGTGVDIIIDERGSVFPPKIPFLSPE